MTTKKGKAQATGEGNFSCKVCQQKKPVIELRMCTDVFPPLLMCRECERTFYLKR